MWRYVTARCDATLLCEVTLCCCSMWCYVTARCEATLLRDVTLRYCTSSSWLYKRAQHLHCQGQAWPSRCKAPQPNTKVTNYSLNNTASHATWTESSATLWQKHETLQNKVNYKIQKSLQITNIVVHMCLIWQANGPPCSDGQEVVSIYMYVCMCVCVWTCSNPEVWWDC
jgi:hypothetical protein